MSAYAADPERDRIHPFLSDVAEIRRRARRHIEQGAATAAGATGREAVLQLLNAALATELACVLRYRRYSVMQTDIVPDALKHEFTKRAQEEQSHADQIAAHIVELGGEPNREPSGAPDRSDIGYGDDEMLGDMLAEDLIAERIAIDTYGEIIRYLGEHEPATRQLIEKIMSAEEGHAEELANLRDDIRRRERAAAAAGNAGLATEAMR
ncbi:MAG TPA: ferritin-like domain-containing protein [Steroidobacteraceae bacterium]|jgi:bacterioferritin|nr:ferritin-like domain-containing protein [Steroidobacteraceae bacterium]